MAYFFYLGALKLSHPFTASCLLYSNPPLASKIPAHQNAVTVQSFQQVASIYSIPNVFLSPSCIPLQHIKVHVLVLALLKSWHFPHRTHHSRLFRYSQALELFWSEIPEGEVESSGSPQLHGQSIRNLRLAIVLLLMRKVELLAALIFSEIIFSPYAQLGLVIAFLVW